jgi:hypothetical protein
MFCYVGLTVFQTRESRVPQLYIWIYPQRAMRHVAGTINFAARLFTFGLSPRRTSLGSSITQDSIF